MNHLKTQIKQNFHMRSNFNTKYISLRKFQNYQWSDECYKKALGMKSINPEKSLEYFKDAIRLDPLNKDLYLNKGILLFKLNVNYLSLYTFITFRNMILPNLTLRSA